MAAEENGRLDWLREDLKEQRETLEQFRAEVRQQFQALRDETLATTQDHEARLINLEQAQELERARQAARLKFIGSLALAGAAAALNMIIQWVRDSIRWQ